jgi:hypothetical protein
MSSILDALEKVEDERIQGLPPGRLPAQRKVEERHLNTWVIAAGVVILLLVNLTIWWLYFGEAPLIETPMAEASMTAISKSQPRLPPVPLVSTVPPKRAPSQVVQSRPKKLLSLREQLSKNTSKNTTPSSTALMEQAQVVQARVQSDVAAKVPEADSESVSEIPPEVLPGPTAVAPGQEMPLVWELSQEVRERVLLLKSSVHVYNEQPEQRFVIINMHRFVEGGTLPLDGYRLHRIDRDGLVIDYGDGLVRLPRR